MNRPSGHLASLIVMSRKLRVGFCLAIAIALLSSFAETKPARAASCDIDTCVFNWGLFTPGSVTTAPPGTNYDFTALGETFSTNPLAYQWGYVDSANPAPQSASAVQAFVEKWTSLDVGSVVEQVDSLPSSTGFASTVAADVIAVHFGGGELVFILQTPLLFSLSNWTGNGLSNLRTYNSVSAVPLPAALPLFVGGLGLMGWMARRRRRQAQTA